MINNKTNLVWITLLIIYLQITEFPLRGKAHLLQEAWWTLFQPE